MDRTTDIIFFSLSRFDDPISFVGFSLAKELSKHNRVFFIEQPYTWKDYLNGRKDAAIQRRVDVWSSSASAEIKDDKIPKGLHYIVPPRMMPANFLPPGALYNMVADWNNAKLFGFLRSLIAEYSISSFLFVNCYNPFYLGSFPGDIKPLLKAYYCVDDISQVAYTRKHGLAAEEKMIREFDVCFATGKELQRLKQVHNHKTHYLPNAGDFDLFSSAVKENLPVPNELKPFVGKKIIGFTGSVEYRTDFELLKKMVAYHHDKVFVVVGPVYAKEVAEMGFDRMENVVFTGAKHISELPAYLQHMDVMIIPYALSTLTRSIYPLKLNEYLGAGKPVVATDFSEDIRSFSDVVYLASRHEVFLQLIDKAIEENNADLVDARMARAKQNTWAARVEQLFDYLQASETH